MPYTAEERFQKQRDQQQATLTKAREKRSAQLADPLWREAQYQKQREAAQRATEKAKQRAFDKPKASKKAKSPTKASPRKASKGLMGRTPTANERRVMDAIGALPCCACALHGVFNTEISLHHIIGRVVDGAHYYVLPLCRWHHQHAADAATRKQYPWLVPVHACGNVGGKTQFNLLNATEMDLHTRVIEESGCSNLFIKGNE